MGHSLGRKGVRNAGVRVLTITLAIMLITSMSVYLLSRKEKTNMGDGQTDEKTVVNQDNNMNEDKPEVQNPGSDSPGDRNGGSSNNQNETSVPNKDNVGDKQKIDSAFFNNSIFIGDSITEGIAYYNLVKKQMVFANKGFTTFNVVKEVNKMSSLNPDKIYILLGTNDLLYGIDSKKYIKDYEGLINEIQRRMPKTKIFIQSILPVTAGISEQKPMLSNSRIDEFNGALREMVQRRGLKYMDISKLFKDGKGNLDEEYSADGIHIKFKGYPIWLNYLSKN